MLRSAHDLTDHLFRARDGDIGRVEDIYFDDAQWTVRHLVVETGRWLPGVVLLVSPREISRVDDSDRFVDLDLTREEIENNPTAIEDEPVSRQKERELHDQYGWKPYWIATPSAIDATLNVAPMRATTISNEPPGKGNDDPALRSIDAVRGYRVEGTDDDAGVVHDFVIDDETWDVRYLVVDTHRWLPGRKVIVSPDWIVGIDWYARRIKVDLDRDLIRRGPAYDPDAPIDEDYERRVHAAYGKTPAPTGTNEDES